jgi:hypothetical protein
MSTVWKKPDKAGEYIGYHRKSGDENEQHLL